MIKDIVKDLDFLSKKSEPFIFEQDEYIIQNLLDTANWHKEICVGLAAPQIGYLKRAIVVLIGDKYVPMINPFIVRKYGEIYRSEEGCLSLEGSRETKRHKDILFVYTDIHGRTVRKHYTGFAAQIIQHEVDHLNGVLI